VPSNELTALFLKAWARYTIALATVEQDVLKDLQSEPAARQQVQALFQTTLSTDAQRREIALRMALAELQVLIEHT
jgi:hypothetical protein